MVDDGGNRPQIRIPPTNKDNPTTDHNRCRDKVGNSIQAKGRSVCSKQWDIDNPFHREA